MLTVVSGRKWHWPVACAALLHTPHRAEGRLFEGAESMISMTSGGFGGRAPRVDHRQRMDAAFAYCARCCTFRIGPRAACLLYAGEVAECASSNGESRQTSEVDKRAESPKRARRSSNIQVADRGKGAKSCLAWRGAWKICELYQTCPSTACSVGELRTQSLNTRVA